MSVMIQVQELTFAYPDKAPIFQDFCWNVSRGEAWAVIGPSGCGKTTLLYLVAGLYRPIKGEIVVDGELIAGPRSTTGLILQDYGLLPWLTAWENAALGLRLNGARGSWLAETVNYWLQRLGIDNVARHYPAQLSGGQRQRVAIARTLALRADLLLLDEPFGSLDAMTREEMQNLVIDLWLEERTTVILVTHNIEEAVLLGQKVLVLGRTPTQSVIILENTGAMRTDYRFEVVFHQTCNELRRRIERL